MPADDSSGGRELPSVLEQARRVAASGMEAARLAADEAEKLRRATETHTAGLTGSGSLRDAKHGLALARRELEEVVRVLQGVAVSSPDDLEAVSREEFNIRQVSQSVTDADIYLQDAEDVYTGKKDVTAAPPLPRLRPLSPEPIEELFPAAPGPRQIKITPPVVAALVGLALLVALIFQMVTGPSELYERCVAAGTSESRCRCIEEALEAGLPRTEAEDFCRNA